MPGPTQQVSGAPGSNPRPNYSRKFCSIPALFLWHCMTLHHFFLVFEGKYTPVTTLLTLSREKGLETIRQSTVLSLAAVTIYTWVHCPVLTL